MGRVDDVVRAGGLAVVTGAASGIGLAAARRFAAAGMRVALVDVAAAVIDRAAEIGGEAAGYPVDVADRGAVERLAAEVQERFGPASILMNNAAVAGGADALSAPDIWAQVVGVNLMGVVHGVQAFLPAMIAASTPALVVNTGSKQGITQPPGNTAYNVSKSGVKALTEGLAHTLRERCGSRITAHLLIPGYTYTGMSRATEKPEAAWWPDQVVGFMLERIDAGDFYILCPDNEVTRAVDEKRMAWTMGDVIENRPALSRWHADWAERFAAYMAE